MATNIPANLKYTKEHEWALVEGDTVTVGITDFAQSALGDIVFLEVPAVGTDLKIGSTFGVVESIKSVSDLYAPISGEVVSKNTDLEGSPEKINEDAYGSWLIKVKVKDSSELNNLLTAEQYQEFCNSSH
ncbi:glycine cleavage system protein GcvH [Peredibacter sp. HCB2-198]|uniref:glycine cleavage system protein GcvH n=1 Tax=Peredibacter sp. HCB2-198 TaxID=3383025 RepID=UPI0038B47EC5